MTTKQSVVIIFFTTVTLMTIGIRLDGFLNSEDHFTIHASEDQLSLGDNIPEQDSDIVVNPQVVTEPHFDNEIEEYIYEVFGEHYDKAMLLLKGNGECGGENGSLNQNAKNKNVHEDGTISWDHGVFQINDHYHPVYELNLDTDWQANVDYAWRMFENDNYTFVRWTAGGCLNI